MPEHHPAEQALEQPPVPAASSFRPTAEWDGMLVPYFDLENMRQDQIRMIGRTVCRLEADFAGVEHAQNHPDGHRHRWQGNTPDHLLSGFGASLAEYFRRDQVARLPFFKQMVLGGDMLEAMAAFEGVRGFFPELAEPVLATMAAADEHYIQSRYMPLRLPGSVPGSYDDYWWSEELACCCMPEDYVEYYVQGMPECELPATLPANKPAAD